MARARRARSRWNRFVPTPKDKHLNRGLICWYDMRVYAAKFEKKGTSLRDWVGQQGTDKVDPFE